MIRHAFDIRQWVAICLALAIIAPAAWASDDIRDWQAMRDKMVRQIKADMRDLADMTGHARLSAPVAAAMDKVPRHLFVPQRMRDHAYDNTPLPIGGGQTISQPLIVALMTELLNVNSRARVLEVGTGSGYQAAVLAEIVNSVYSIEIVPSLADAAAERLARLGYRNVHVKQGDGTLGWPDAAPFDGIVVTAAGMHIPRDLLAQLKPGARLVMPVGGEHETQQLMVITRNMDGTYSRRTTIPVRFVPITH